jgi:mutator protein MutT
MSAAVHAVSVKGVVFLEGLVPLLKNERDEWELPGGRLEEGEDPEACVVREIAEELSIGVTARRILDSWSYEVLPGRRVLIITYLCESANVPADCRVSNEHKELALVEPARTLELAMPDGYRRSIRAAMELRGRLMDAALSAT